MFNIGLFLNPIDLCGRRCSAGADENDGNISAVRPNIVVCVRVVCQNVFFTSLQKSFDYNRRGKTVRKRCEPTDVGGHAETRLCFIGNSENSIE